MPRYLKGKLIRNPLAGIRQYTDLQGEKTVKNFWCIDPREYWRKWKQK